MDWNLARYLPPVSASERKFPNHIPLVAEIGVNHNGDLGLAKDLIALAASVGCDAVKFQKRTVETVYSDEFLRSPRESPWGSTQLEQKNGLEFQQEEYSEIDSFCRELGIDWSASAWDVKSLEFIEAFDPPFHKIASALNSHLNFVQAVAELRRPTLISTGMATLDAIDEIVRIFEATGTPFTLLHSVSTYPTPDTDLNLLAIETLRKRYGVPVGYSGHESSVSPSIVAAALGAQVIERHITLDRTMYGSDQSASLEEPGLRQLVGALRKLPSMVGSGVKEWMPGEIDTATKLRYWEVPGEE